MKSDLVLVVDDDEMNVVIMEEILGDHYPLIIAHNGREAIEMAKKYRPTVILMDIMMPEVDGYEACKQIKAAEESRFTNIILVSAKASVDERLRGYEVGADDYLVKPFDEDELLAKVKIHYRLQSALKELAVARAEVVEDNVRLENVVNDQAITLVDTQDLLVFALAKLAESRDPETGEHLERMRAYCQILAEELSVNGPYVNEVDDDFKRNIYRSSPLHDIGKVGIPDAILLKPGRLSNAEFEIMKHHTKIGSEALAEVGSQGKAGGFLTMAIEIARSHHERFDGTGYPDGVGGTKIPLAARITSLADVFDALTSIRVYKDEFSVEVARSMITSESGSHFDPAIVAAFEDRFEDFVITRSQLNSHVSRTTHGRSNAA